jgi:hypothetical protein
MSESSTPAPRDCPADPANPPQSQQPKRRGSIFRFSLRTLLIFAPLAAIG